MVQGKINFEMSLKVCLEPPEIVLSTFPSDSACGQKGGLSGPTRYRQKYPQSDLSHALIYSVEQHRGPGCLEINIPAAISPACNN